MSTYRIGTVTVANGSTSVTGSGTSWSSVGVRAGDFLFVNGLFGEIASVQSNTALTLVRGWPGSNASGQQYSIALIDDGQRSIASLNQVLQALGQGTLTSLSALNASANTMPFFTGPGVMGLTALTAAARTLLGRAVIETQSATDTTAGRLMRVADAGILATSVAPLSDANPADPATAPTRIITMTSGTANVPGPRSVYSGVRTKGNNTNQVVDFLISYQFGLDPLLVLRHNNNTDGVYRSSVYNPTIGTVSQSAGVPTGAIIQRGSNANGVFVRFADGTQICHHVITTSADAAVTWTYPAAFAGNAATDLVCIASIGSGGSASLRTIALPSRNLTSQNVNVFASTGRIVETVNIMAFGRWF